MDRFRKAGAVMMLGDHVGTVAVFGCRTEPREWRGPWRCP